MRFIGFIAIASLVSAAWAQSANVQPKSARPATVQAPIDQLIPWLLDEDQQLRGVPFGEVIFDTTGKKSFRLMRTTQSISASQKRSAPPPMSP
jgi:hypothetical protein